MTRLFLIGLFAASFLLASCDKDDDKEDIVIEDIEVMDIDDYAELYFPDAKPVEGLGMYVIITDEGSGDPVKDGDLLYTYYVGKLLDKNPVEATKFDSTYARAHPDSIATQAKVLSFQLDLKAKDDDGKERVRQFIDGWYRGFSQLKLGSKAVFLIPGSLAYGDTRRGIIPPNAALMFEVDLLKIK